MAEAFIDDTDPQEVREVNNSLLQVITKKLAKGQFETLGGGGKKIEARLGCVKDDVAAHIITLFNVLKSADDGMLGKSTSLTYDKSEDCFTFTSLNPEVEINRLAGAISFSTKMKAVELAVELAVQVHKPPSREWERN